MNLQPAFMHPRNQRLSMERPFQAYKGEDPYIFVSYAHADAALVYPELVRLKETDSTSGTTKASRRVRPGATKWRSR